MKKSIPNEWKSDLPEAQEDELLQKAFRQKFDAELRQKWAGRLAEEGIRRQPEARIVPMRSRRMSWWAVAASLVVLLGAAWWLFLKPSQPEAIPIANQYFAEIVASAAQTRMGEGDSDLAWQTAQDQYAQGKFADAANSMVALSNSKPLDTGQHYFFALCLLQTEPASYQLALQQLEAARQANLARKTDSFQEEIEWVQALAWLKSGDPAAIGKLEEIAKAGGWFAEKAQALLKAE